VSRRSQRERPAFLLGALLFFTLGATGVSCQTEELRLFDPLRANNPDAAVPRDVVPGTIPDRDAGPPPASDDAGEPSPETETAPSLQPACEAASAACRTCIAAQNCEAPAVCHPSSGNCVSACPGGQSDCTTSGAPFCSPTYAVCVGCLNDADCSGSTPACNTAAGVCVECLRDEHCALGGHADAPHCNVAAQACQECVVDADCGAGLACETSEGHCDDSGGSGGDDRSGDD
jgi:hypothetical protein